MNKKQTLLISTLVFMIALNGEARLNSRQTKKLPGASAGTFGNGPYNPNAEKEQPFLINISDLDDSDNSVDEDPNEVITQTIDSGGATVTPENPPLPTYRPDTTTTEAVKADAPNAPQADTSDNSNLTDGSSFANAWIKAGVPERALRKAFEQIKNDLKRTAVVPLSRGKPASAIKKTISITNHRYLIINDFTRPSSQKRMFLLDFKTGAVMTSLVAHGDGTGLLNATNFALANKDRSHQTTPGFHVISEIYYGKHGASYALDGLENRNAGARARLVVIHAAPKYATQDFVNRRGYLGRSNGCPAVPPETMKKLLDQNGPSFKFDSKKGMGTAYLTGAMLYNYTSLDAK